jgi:hypothetical protein
MQRRFELSDGEAANVGRCRIADRSHSPQSRIRECSGVNDRMWTATSPPSAASTTIGWPRARIDHRIG